MVKRTKLFIGIAVIYWLLPDLMPGIPIDDILVSVICAIANKKLSDGNQQKLIE